MEKIFIKTEYIKLGQLLKFASIINSGADAKEFLLEEKVLINDEEDNRRGRKIYNNDVVLVKGKKYLVVKEG